MRPLPCDIAATGIDRLWTIGGMFLDALARRDFVAIATCFEPDVRFRALVPPGPLYFDGVGATTDKLRAWFDTDETLDVVDASIGQIGTRLYLRWRIRLTARDASARVVEQHVFATLRDRIESFDLLCSGFQPDVD
jgi:hypothetical protein